VSTNGYQYVIELFRDDDESLGQVTVKVDWGPAEEWAKFQALRLGTRSANEAGRILSIEPLWLHETAGPYLRGFRVIVATTEGQTETDFSSSYFKGLAAHAANRFIEKGRLETGQRFRFLAAAFLQKNEESNAFPIKFTSEEIVQMVEVRDASVTEQMAKSIPYGSISSGDLPVFVPQRVLDQITILSRGAGAKETGGILLGFLHRDATISDMFVEVTDQVHARHTEADLTKLTFTSETWTDVQAAIDIRRKREIMVGWWHSHPVREWCRDCARERQQVCRMSSDFFSAHDHALHRTVFPAAYSIALVANDLPNDEVTFSAFGWREALIEPRGFHVLSAKHAKQHAK